MRKFYPPAYFFLQNKKIFGMLTQHASMSASFFLIALLLGIKVSAQPTQTTAPGNYSTCVVSSNTNFTNTPFDVDKGTCGANTFSFQWQYNNGGTWVNVSSGVPTGFVTYAPNSSTASNQKSGSSSLKITISSAAAAGTYQFRSIATVAGCAQTLISSTCTFTINALPTPTFTAQPGATACINTNVTYTTQAGQSGYSWNIPGTASDYSIVSMSGATLAASNSITLKWLTAGSKTVTINYSNPTTGCTAATATSSTATVVSVPPTPAFSVQPSGTICSSTDVTYTIQTTGGESNFIWSVPGASGTDYSITSGGIGTSSSSVTLKWLTAGSKVVTINYTNSGGCTAASATSSNSITVTSRPVPSFTASPGANTCSSTDVTYTTQSGQSSYVWSIPGNAGTDYTITSGSTSSNTITLKWLTAGSKTVTVNYTSSSCTGLTAASSTTTVNLKPTVTFTSSAGANTCANTDVTYTTQAGQSNYIWSVEGTAGIDYSISSGGTGTNSNSVTLKWLTSGASRTVTVNYTNGSGCSASTATASTTLVNTRPTPTFSTSPDPTTCANTNVTYTTQSGAGITNYVWNVPGTANVDYVISSGGIGTNNNSVTLQWLTSDSKTVTVNYNNANGCNALTAASSSTTVTVPAAPTISGGPTTFCSGGSVTLTSSAGSTYQWYKDGATISGAAASTYVANASASYTVKVFDAAGCNATSASTTVTVYPLPSITMSAQATSTCFSSSSQVGKLAYSAVTGSPTLYSLSWNAAATTAGFTAVTNAALPASPISITVPANAPIGIYTGTITVANANGCTSGPTSFTLEVTAPPNVTDFTISAADACLNSGATITVNSSSLAAGTYTITYDLSGANNASGNTAILSFNGITGTFQTSALLNTGATSITVNQVASVGCTAVPSAGNTGSFTVNALPAVSATSGSNKVCVGGTTPLTNATSGGSWSSSNSAIATVNNSGLVTGVAGGTVNIIYTTPSSGGCTNSYSFAITVNALPTISPITGTTSLCVNTTTQLANATTGGTWTSGSTSVATVNNTTGLVQASATNSGTSVISYALTDANGCSNSVTTTVTVDQAATVNAGTDAFVCQSASPSALMLTGASVGGGATTGAWSIVSGGGTLSSTAQTATPATVTYTPAANYNGSVTLQLITNVPNSCPAVTATKSITVSQTPSVTAGPTVTVCQSASPSPITLSGATVTGGANTGAWSITSGSGTLSSTAQTTNPELVTFTPAANTSGNVVLTLTTNLPAGCTAATATRTITVTATPTVTAGGPNTVCQGSSAVALSGSSFGGGATTGAWSITSGGGTLSTTAQTASPSTVTYTPAAAFTGTVTLTLTTDAPGGCAAVNGTRTINVSTPPTATAGGPNTICQSASPSALMLTGASVGGGATTGAWSIVSGGGTLSSTAQTATPATVTYTPAANSTTTVTLRLTTDVLSGCTAATSDRTITFTAAPTAVAGTAIKTCADASQTASGSAAVNITAGASATNYTSLLWTSSGTGTFTNPTSLTLATYTPSAADKAAGSVTLTLTALGNSPCTSATSQKTFTITPAIDVNSANNWTQIATCSGNGVQFGLTAAPTGGDGSFTYQWMLKNNCGVAGTSTPIPGATSMTYLPTNLSDCHWLYVTSGGCATPQNLVSTTTREKPDAAVIASSLPTVSANANPICIGSSATLNVTTAVSYTYSWTSSPAGFTSTSASPIVNPSTTTIYNLTATSTDGLNCQKTASITVTVNPLATLSSVASTAVCSGSSTTITLNGLLASSTSTVSYKIGSGTVQSASNVVSNASGVATFTVPVTSADNGQTFTVTQIGSSISGGPSCSKTFSSGNSTTLVVNTAPSITTQPITPAATCSGSGTQTISVVATGTGLTYSWRKGGVAVVNGGVISGQGTATLTLTNPTTTDAGSYDVVVSGTCTPAVTSSAVTVTINTAAAITTQPVAPAAVCAGSGTATISVAATGTGLTYQWRRNGTNLSNVAPFSNVTTSTLTITNPAATDAGNYDVVVTGTCGTATTNAVSVSVTPAPAITTQPVAQTPCVNSSVTLLVQATNVASYQWYKGGSPIAGATAATFTISKVALTDNGNYYVVLTGTSPCTTLQSNTVSITAFVSTTTTWTSGTHTNDWDVDANWTCGVPTPTTDAIVPIVPDPYPTVKSGVIGYVKDLTIQNAAGLPAYVNVIAGGTLQHFGSINNGGVYDATGGSIEFNGNTITQNITATDPSATYDVKDMTVNTTLVNLSTPLNLYGKLKFAGNNRTFQTNDGNLTLKSNASTTAMVTDITNNGVNSGNQVAGNVWAERSVSSTYVRRWRLVTVPVTGTTINASWQEGKTWAGGTPETGTGYGTLISGGKTMTSAAMANALGYDYVTPTVTASIRAYQPSSTPTTNIDAFWVPLVTGTKTVGFDSYNAYLLFVRGDRSQTAVGGSGTTLRGKGPLREEPSKYSMSVTVPAQQSYTLIGNPFASPINFYSFYNDNAGKIKDFFWIWKSSLNTVGGYALERPVSTGSSTYEEIPYYLNNPGSATAGSSVISSGEGFFVVPNTAADVNVTIKQTHKTTNNPASPVLRQQDNRLKTSRLYVNVNADIAGANTLLDGALVLFAGTTEPDGNDVPKAWNGTENLAVHKEGRELIVGSGVLPERGDTVQLRFWNSKQRDYRFEIKSADFSSPEFSAFLLDKYLNKLTPINLGDAITSYDFSVAAEAGSRDQLRFAVVFSKVQAPLPLVLSELKAYENAGGGVAVEWKVADEQGIKAYEVEKSTDGQDFQALTQVAARAGIGSQAYQTVDLRPSTVNYYRIKMVGTSGEVKYSAVVKVALARGPEGVRLYPNPLQANTALQMHFMNKPAGKYLVTLISLAGQQVYKKTIYHAGGNGIHRLMLGAELASGSYTVQIKSANGKTETLPLEIAR